MYTNPKFITAGGRFYNKLPTYVIYVKKKNSVVLVRKRTIQIERPQPAGEVSANFS
jgi:hypothetical protein